MRAAVFQPGQKMMVCEVPDPQCGEGQLTIKVKRCGICGSDLHVTNPAEGFNLAPGTIIGHEFCGEIVDVGPGLGSLWKEGQRITAVPFMGCGQCANCAVGQPVWCAKSRTHTTGGVPGGFAEYVVVGAGESVRIPDSLSWAEGALIEPLAVGLHAVNLGQLSLGANVLVMGAGPIGLTVVACAKAAGAGKVIVADISTQRADLARAVGATEFLLSDERLAEEFARIAGGPPDVVFECVGAPGLIDQCTRLAAPRSTVVVVGVCMKPDQFIPTVPLSKELRLQFAMAYGKRDFEVAAELIARGRVDVSGMVTEVVGFGQFPDALEALRERTTQCKVLLDPEL